MIQACLVRSFGCLLLVVAATGTFAEVAEFLPDASGDEAPTLDGETWIGDGPGFTLRLRQLDEVERLAYLKHVTGFEIDPFATPPGEDPRFITFALVIDNLSKGSLSFQTGTFWLKTNKDEILTPVGASRLVSQYGQVDRELPEAYNRVLPVVLESSRTLAPEESVAGLLVYRMFKPKTKRFHVDLKLSLPTGDVVRLSAPYRRKNDKDK